MTFAIPKGLKDLNSLTFDLVLPVELNDTDVERMLTAVMERAIKQGRVAGSKTDPGKYREHLAQLSASPDMAGFNDVRGQEVLDGWLRASVVEMGTVGLKRVGEQMDYVRPLTVASYRAGLPKSRSRHRKADALAYRSMLQEVSARGGVQLQKELAELFHRSLGRGVDVGVNPWPNPRYDGETELDVNELLALRFLETFGEHRNPTKDGASSNRVEAIPGATAPIGRDIVLLLSAFGEEWSPAEVVSGMAALLSLRLFQLPLRLAAACRDLLSGGIAADVIKSDSSNPLELYCDFTRRRGGASDDVARQCVARDLESLRGFFSDRLLLRSVSQAAAVTIDHGNVQQLEPQEQLMALAGLVGDPQVEMAMKMQLNQIEQELDDSDSAEEGRHLIADLRISGLSGSDQLVTVLVEGLRKRGLENQEKWFWTTGGLVAKGPNRPYSLLEGTVRARSTWRYAPGDELLTAVLSMCFVEGSGRVSPQLPIAVILERLRERFGILIDQPPRELDSADARAGATENLQAFCRQLQLLGCFRGLSDDFSAQYVTRPREVRQ